MVPWLASSLSSLTFMSASSGGSVGRLIFLRGDSVVFGFAIAWSSGASDSLNLSSVLSVSFLYSSMCFQFYVQGLTTASSTAFVPAWCSRRSFISVWARFCNTIMVSRFSSIFCILLSCAAAAILYLLIPTFCRFLVVDSLVPSSCVAAVVLSTVQVDAKLWWLLRCWSSL